MAFFKCKYSLVLLLIHVTNPWKRKRMRKWGFYEYLFFYFDPDLQMKRASTILFSIWINDWSINQSSVEYQQKSLIIAFSNTVESKVALRRPWQDYRQTKHAMEQVRSNAVAGFLRRPRYTISLKLCHPLSLVIVGTCNSFAGAV